MLVAADKVEEDKLLELALDAGADDVKRVDDNFEITCDPSALGQVSAALEKHGIPVDVKEIGRIPTSSVDLDARNRGQGAGAAGAVGRSRRREVRRLELQHSAGSAGRRPELACTLLSGRASPYQARIPWMTLAPSTPVSLASRPWNLTLKASCSMPSWCSIVACRSCTVQTFSTAA